MDFSRRFVAFAIAATIFFTLRAKVTYAHGAEFIRGMTMNKADAESIYQIVNHKHWPEIERIMSDRLAAHHEELEYQSGNDFYRTQGKCAGIKLMLELRKEVNYTLTPQ